MTQPVSTHFAFSKAQVLLTALFITANLTYFTMAPRVMVFAGLYEPGGILIFPFTFLLSDIITEVYSYRYSRFLIWCVILCLGIFSLFAAVSMAIPSAYLNDPYPMIFMHYPLLFCGVAVATLVGFFLNNYIIAKLKIRMHGRRFWLRSLLSTSIGHAAFSATWVLIFHSGQLGSLVLLKLIGCMYAWKMSFELLATPLASFISQFLKRVEGEIYDTNTNFSPFSIFHPCVVVASQCPQQEE